MTPIGHVMAFDQEWCKIVQRGLRLGHVDTVVGADIFREHNHNLVPDGATGSPKLKRLPCGSTVELQRFISNLAAVNAYFCRVRGDSSLSPPVFRLGLVLVEGETLEIDSEDMESAFNLFRMLPVWKSFFAFAKKVPCSVYPGGNPDKWVYVAITTVPMGWVGAVDLIEHIARRKVGSQRSHADVLRALSHRPSLHSVVCMDGLDVVSSSNVSSNQWYAVVYALAKSLW